MGSSVRGGGATRKLPEAKLKKLQPAPGDARTQRKCGNCSACCLVLGVPEINKPRMHMCSNAKMGKGCTIHDTRPTACMAYNCLWLDGWFEMRHKPNRFGLIFDRPDEMSRTPIWADIPFVVARAVKPGAERSKEGETVIRALADQMVVMVVTGNKRKFRGPQQLVKKVLDRSMGQAVELEPIPGQKDKFALKPVGASADNDDKGGQNPPDSEG